MKSQTRQRGYTHWNLTIALPALVAAHMQSDSISTLEFDQEYQRSVAQTNDVADNKIKRGFDVLFAIFSILISSPVLIVAALAVMLESAGGAVFVQRRVGRNGEIFNIYKLRTMYAGSSNHSDGFKTAKEDRRLTRVGTILRRTNVDELPQLFNVLLGDMSLIGPRPLSVDETSYIGAQLNVNEYYPGFRPSVRPGLVGLEQVNRTRDLTYFERFHYNHEYEQNWSLSLDWHIFCRALLVCKHVCIAALLGAGAIGGVSTMLIELVTK